MPAERRARRPLPRSQVPVLPDELDEELESGQVAVIEDKQVLVEPSQQ